MNPRGITACLLGLAVLVAGCGGNATSGESASQSSPPLPSTSPTTAVPISSITCSPARPAGNFQYSSDHDELSGLAASIGKEVGLPGTFDDVDANDLAVLMEHHFIDPGGSTNGSPTMWEFHKFLCEHPDVRAIGFTANMGMNGAKGPEAIASLETIYATTIDDALRRDARAFCATASEKTMRTHLECFWD